MVLCTVYPVYLVAQEIASGTDAKIDLFITSSFGCPHDYSATPGDIQNFQRADVVIMSGLGFEPFLEHLFKGNKIENLIDCSKDAEVLSDESGSKRPNPHFFTTPKGVIKMAENIALGLSRLDPERASKYQLNLTKFRDYLSPVFEAWAQGSKDLAVVSVVLTHGSQDYLAHELGFRVIARVEINHEEEISAKELMGLIKLIRAEKAKVIFVDEQHSSKILETLSDETHVPLLKLNFLTSGEKSVQSGYLKAHFLDNLKQCKEICNRSVGSRDPPKNAGFGAPE